MGRKSKQNFRRNKKSIFAVSPSLVLQYLVKTLSQSFLCQPLSSSFARCVIISYDCKQIYLSQSLFILHSFRVLVDFLKIFAYSKSHFLWYTVLWGFTNG